MTTSRPVSPARPAQPVEPAQIDMSEVLEELSKDPMGRALLERAQYLVLARGYETELRYLRSLQPSPEGGS